MKCTELNQMERPAASSARPEKNKGVIHLPAGLLGFEQARNYILLGSAEEAPFMWLQMTDEPSYSFLVVEPCRVIEDYKPDLADEDVEFLGLNNPEDALLFNIATLHADGSVTANLKGPIVINRYTLVGKQVIPRNVSDYSLQHALATTTVETN